MNDDLDDQRDAQPGSDDVFRAFGMACRTERDRLARERLDVEDRRFDAAIPARRKADRLAAELLASVSRP
jgi:hypothetical protein